jgi:signal transduction histidine kinase
VSSTPQIQLDALHALARALAAGEFRARAVLERACAATRDGFGFARVGIVRYLPETSMLVPFAAHGLTAAEMTSLPPALPISSFAAFERARASARTVFVADASGEDALPTAIRDEFGLGSFAIVPLVSDGRCLGFMTCDERGMPFTLDPMEIELLTTFGTLIAAFLEKAIEHGELRRLNELKSQFAALASHELRTPAAAIYGAVRTLNERDEQLSAEQRAELRGMLSTQAERLVELVENLLDLSRLEADAIAIRPAPIAVADRLRRLADAVGGGGAAVRVEAPGELCVDVDAQAFDRIVSNLLANALRHGAPPVAVQAAATVEGLHVTVEDGGQGVPDEFVGSLFERFTRAGTGTGEGAGLGLSIAQSYARAHGGAIRYERATPHGARFHLVLPLG